MMGRKKSAKKNYVPLPGERVNLRGHDLSVVYSQHSEAQELDQSKVYSKKDFLAEQDLAAKYPTSQSRPSDKNKQELGAAHE